VGPIQPPTKCENQSTLIYLLTAVGLSPGGSTHLHTNNTYNTNNNRTTQITTNVEECGPCTVLASFTLVFVLQLRKKHGKTSVRVRKPSVRLRKTSVRLRKTSVRVRKTSVRVRKTSVRVRKTSVRLRKTSVRVQCTYYQTPTHYKTLTNTNITKPTHTHTHIHILQILRVKRSGHFLIPDLHPVPRN